MGFASFSFGAKCNDRINAQMAKSEAEIVHTLASNDLAIAFIPFVGLRQGPRDWLAVPAKNRR